MCPVTGQPDFGVITIETIPDMVHRTEIIEDVHDVIQKPGIFHEAVTGKIAKDIIATIEPRWLKITGDFTVRGGIKTMVVFEHRAK